MTDQVRTECINNFVGNYPGLKIQQLLKPQYQNYLQLPDLVRIGDELIMSRTGTPKGPLFIGVGNADGTGDGVMVANDVEALAHTYCQRGVPLQFNVYSGDDHGDAAVPFEQGALTFLTDRLNDEAVPNGCSSVGTGNSLVPLPVPKAAPGQTPRPKLRFRSFGRVKRFHGLDVKLWTSGGTLKKVVVTLDRGHRRIARFTIARLTKHKRRLIFRYRRHMPPAGRYTLRVEQDRKTLLRRAIRLR